MWGWSQENGPQDNCTKIFALGMDGMWKQQQGEQHQCLGKRE